MQKSFIRLTALTAFAFITLESAQAGIWTDEHPCVEIGTIAEYSMSGYQEGFYQEETVAFILKKFPDRYDLIREISDEAFSRHKFYARRWINLTTEEFVDEYWEACRANPELFGVTQ